MLVEALPYIQRFRGRVVVVKYGGNAMVDPALATSFAEDIVLMHSVGLRPVVVHGGGPQISDLMERLGKVPEFRDGQRVTDAETVDIARMVLVGKVNRDIVGSINVHGPLAVGVSGEDAGLIRAEARHPDLGFVGDVEAVNPSILERLLAEDLIPVVSTIGADASGQAYNINADAVAGALAEALGAEKVIYLTDIEGLLADLDDPGSLISRIDAKALQALLDDGTLTRRDDPEDRRVPPRRGRRASGRRTSSTVGCPHVVLLELFSDAGVGTMITAEPTHDRARGGHGRAAARPLPADAHLRAAGAAARARRGVVAVGQGRAAGTSTCCRAWPSPASATATRRWPTALHEQAQTLLHVSNLFGTDVGWQVACTLDRLLGVGQPGWPAEGTRGQVFFANSGAEANECALKLARQVRRPGPPRGRERLRLVPRPHPGHAARHRPAGQARGVPAAARGLPARRLERPRRARGARSTRRWPRCCSSRCRARAA